MKSDYSASASSERSSIGGGAQFLYAALSRARALVPTAVLAGFDLWRRQHGAGLASLGRSALRAHSRLMFRNWAKDRCGWMRRPAWLRQAHRYAMHNEGRTSRGRTLQCRPEDAVLDSVRLAALFLFLSGLVLWFPEAMPRPLRLAAILIHPIAAIVSIGGIIVHIYMGTAAVPEAFRGMIHGWVRPGWAASHHPKWYRQIKKRS